MSGGLILSRSTAKQDGIRIGDDIYIFVKRSLKHGTLDQIQLRVIAPRDIKVRRVDKNGNYDKPEKVNE